MPKHSISVEVHFSAGHRILGHKGRCRFLHGHSYTAKVTVDAVQVDDLGMVVDFGEIKAFLKAWIDQFWDHNMILHQDDPLASLIGMGYAVEGNAGKKVKVGDIFADKTPFIMSHNPTAENMAKVLFAKVDESLKATYDKDGENYKIRRVLLREVAIKEEDGAWAYYTA